MVKTEAGDSGRHHSERAWWREWELDVVADEDAAPPPSMWEAELAAMAEDGFSGAIFEAGEDGAAIQD